MSKYPENLLWTTIMYQLPFPFIGSVEKAKANPIVFVSRLIYITFLKWKYLNMP